MKVTALILNFGLFVGFISLFLVLPEYMLENYALFFIIVPLLIALNIAFSD